MMLVQFKGPPNASWQTLTNSCLAVGSPMGQRRRDICMGVPPVKLLWTRNSNSLEFCRQTATVERKDRVINSLRDAPRVTHEDVHAAAQRVAGEVERTPLIESD